MDMALKRMDNVLIVVDDLEAAKAFFIELGLELEGEQTVEGPSVGKLIGLKDVRATLAMLRTPDGQGIELDKFHTPDAIRFGPVDAPVNTLGFRRVMFAVDRLDEVVARMRAHGAELIGEMQYGDTYRLACSLASPLASAHFGSVSRWSTSSSTGTPYPQDVITRSMSATMICRRPGSAGKADASDSHSASPGSTTRPRPQRRRITGFPANEQ